MRSAPASKPRWTAWLRGSMTPVFVALTAALLALGLLITQSIVAQQDARARAMSEGDMLLAFQTVMRTMLEAESSQRGYALTGDGDYLGPYLEAKRRLGPAITALRASAAGDAETARRVNWIAGLTDAKFTEMDRTVTLTRTGMRAQAQIIIDSDIGRQQMDAIRAAIAGETARKADQRRDAFVRAARFEGRLLPLVAVLGLGIVALLFAGFRAERSRATAAAEAEQAGALREANDRAQLLARELNHRVKNLFSVILSIVALSGRKQGSGREVVESIRARIHALSLAHATSQGAGDTASVDLRPVIGRTMEPYADEDGRRIRTAGPDVRLPTRMVTPIGMIVHELATNAVKYGALSADGGTIVIVWEIHRNGAGDDLLLDWTESGGPPLAFDEAASPPVGFGSQMITLAAHQLGGSVEREWPVSGAVIRLRFPLPSTQAQTAEP